MEKDREKKELKKEGKREIEKEDRLRLRLIEKN